MVTGELTDPNVGMPPSSDAYTVMVLLVDDQVMVAESIRRMLSDQPNIHFHYCADPTKAVALAAEVKPTVILQDLIMPGIDGLDLVRQYRADPLTRGIPIIVLSTKEDPSIKSEAFKAGANDYLVKLPNKIEVLARIYYHSKSYLNQLQRDEAYRALRESQQRLMEANLALQRLTNVDGLTGLSNRRYFDEYAEAEWRRSIRSGNPLSVLMVDIDHFKQYNNCYGHLSGDEVLKKIAEILQDNCERTTDVVARFGGEEFILLLSATPLSGAQYLGEKLRKEIEGLEIPHMASPTSGCITVSIGGASTTPKAEETVFRLIEAADQALYEAKDKGRNRSVMRQEDFPSISV